MGYGFEIVSHYANCSLTFCDIENIHVMRNSVAKVRELLYAADDSKFLAGVVESGWLRHQYQILSSAVKIVDLVHTHNTSVLVHCSMYLCSLANY
jgi:myotubularin-related protein 1/2